MSRLAQIKGFLEFEGKRNRMIEPPSHLEAVWERLLDVVHTYRPGVIVKTGIGSGLLLESLARESDSYIVVVEPSSSLVAEFLGAHRGDESMKKINFIIGDFHDFPIDYYKADLLVTVDILDLFDASRCLDEFKRALQWEGILFMSGVVLDDRDVEGVYDDFVRSVSPLHNDFYLEEDLMTFLELKEFSFIKGMRLSFTRSLKDDIEHYESFYGKGLAGSAGEYLKYNSGEMESMYGLDGDMNITEHYFVGYFMKNKPAPSTPGI